jgi:hypothetical protein
MTRTTMGILKEFLGARIILKELCSPFSPEPTISDIFESFSSRMRVLKHLRYTQQREREASIETPEVHTTKGT